MRTPALAALPQANYHLVKTTLSLGIREFVFIKQTSTEQLPCVRPPAEHTLSNKLWSLLERDLESRAGGRHFPRETQSGVGWAQAAHSHRMYILIQSV